MSDLVGAQLIERLQTKPVLEPSVERDIVHSDTSSDGELKVFRSRDPMNRVMLTYHTCDVYTQSVLYPEEPLRDLQGAMYLIPALLGPPRSILVLGSAAGGCLRQIEVAYPAAKVVAVDMDRRAHEVAEKIFNVNTRQSTLVTADARTYLHECSERFDLIIVDLFAGTSMPPHCLVQGFFKRVCELLTPDGGLFLNTNMDDLPFELPRALDAFRPIRHLQSTLATSGFQSILENSYFNSLFAFRSDVSIERFRRVLLERLDDTAYPSASRAAAGIAAYTTVLVHAKPELYRPFDDDWSPVFAPTSVRAGIYVALRSAGVEEALQALGSGAESVPDRVLRVRFDEWHCSGEPALRNLKALLVSLNEVEGALPKDGLDTAARFFRFRGRLPEVDVPVCSPWARLALLYSRLYIVGYRNDHEALLTILRELRTALDTEGGARDIE